MRRIAESTVRRLSIYLSFLEEIEERGVLTTSSDDLARLGGTTSAQVRKDLSFFGSFGKRGLGYSVPELSSRLREILGLGRQWKVAIVGVGKVGSALARYAGFAERVNSLKAELVALLADRKEKGARIAAYGAAAKGATLLNFFGINAKTIEFVVDRSTHKQGRYMPGARIPILPPSALRDKQPDYCVLLTWNFADEILEQQQAYRDDGGKFILPIPSVRIV